MNLRSLKNYLSSIRSTPFHPQWFTYRHFHSEMQQISKILSGKRILDVGCGKQELRSYLPQKTEYFGLDYYRTATEWYHSKPQIYGDAQALPFPNACMDGVLLMDVLEHLPNPQECLKEITRVLRPGGLCIVQVPFLYPMHDAPLDFQRWTYYGMISTVKEHDLTIQQVTQIGKPAETAALLTNIALCKSLVNWVEHKSPLVIIGMFLPLFIPLVNTIAWLAGLLSPKDDMMPFRLRFILRKQI